MAKIGFNIRRMQSGELGVAEFADVAAAEAWLIDRPAFTEVLRLTEAIEPDIEARLRAAMRPLDATERASALALEADADARRAEENARLQKQRDDSSSDPNRPMVIRWELQRGVFLQDESDERSVPPVVEQAVLAWVAERDTWVEGRGQRVAAASLSVWPGPIPGGDPDDRIARGGQFVTCSRDAAEG